MKAIHYVILVLAAAISSSHAAAVIFPHYAVQILGIQAALMPVIAALALVSGSASDKQIAAAVAQVVAPGAPAPIAAPTEPPAPPATTTAGPS